MLIHQMLQVPARTICGRIGQLSMRVYVGQAVSMGHKIHQCQQRGSLHRGGFLQIKITQYHNSRIIGVMVFHMCALKSQVPKLPYAAHSIDSEMVSDVRPLSPGVVTVKLPNLLQMLCGGVKIILQPGLGKAGVMDRYELRRFHGEHIFFFRSDGCKRRARNNCEGLQIRQALRCRLGTGKKDQRVVVAGSLHVRTGLTAGRRKGKVLSADGRLDHQAADRERKDNYAILIIGGGTRTTGRGHGGGAGVKCGLAGFKLVQCELIVKQNQFGKTLPADLRSDIYLCEFTITQQMAIAYDFTPACGPTNTYGTGTNRW